MDEEQRRKAFVEDEANLELAVADATEIIRALLRALAAKDPDQMTERTIANLRSLLKVYRDDLPAERVLQAAIARLKKLDVASGEDGYIVETTLPAIRYFAEATAPEHHFSDANRRRAKDEYREAIQRIDEIDRLRREHRRDGR